jgi:hypothetical protein
LNTRHAAHTETSGGVQNPRPGDEKSRLAAADAGHTFKHGQNEHADYFVLSAHGRIKSFVVLCDVGMLCKGARDGYAMDHNERVAVEDIRQRHRRERYSHPSIGLPSSSSTSSSTSVLPVRLNADDEEPHLVRNHEERSESRHGVAYDIRHGQPTDPLLLALTVHSDSQEAIT